MRATSWGARAGVRVVVGGLLAAVVGVPILGSPVGAATFTVVNTDDSGAGSLRAAIEDANLDPDADTIVFGPAAVGTILLTSGELEITEDLEIVGPGADVLSVSGGGASRVLSIADGATVSISGLTITGGHVEANVGGEVFASPPDGGDGEDGVVANGADGDDGSSSNGDDSALTSASGVGGGIANAGDLTLTDVAVTGNSVVAGPGAIATAIGGDGGNGGHGIDFPGGNGGNGGSASVVGANGGHALGGGVYNAATGSLTIVNSTIADNTVTAGDGGDATATGGNGGNGGNGSVSGGGGNGGDGGDATAVGGRGGDAFGAAIYSEGALAVRNSTIAENATVAGSTGAAAETPGDHGDDGTGPLSGLYGDGGTADATGGSPGTTAAAVYVAGTSTATLLSVTVADNTAGGSGTTANLHAEAPATVTVTNSILAGTDPLCSGTIDSGGFNIDEGSTCGFGEPTDLSSTDPLLGSLQLNGGTTETIAPLFFSPAVDAGTAGGLTTDQRGIARPTDQVGVVDATGSDGSDIGAVELPPPLELPASLPDGQVGDAYTASVAATGGVPPISYAVMTGALPDGVTLDTDTGDLTGTPTTAGDATFSIEATDATNVTTSASYTVAIIDISTPPVPPGGGGGGGPGPDPGVNEPACPEGMPDDPFTDVAPTSVHREAIRCLWFRDLTAGTGPTSYSPLEPTTRAQMATFLARLHAATGGTSPADPPNAFDDDDGDVHEPSIDELAALDIAHGVAPRIFEPRVDLTRAELASFLVRLLAERGIVAAEPLADAFTDDDGNVHEPAINAAAALGIVTGVGDGRFDPEGTVTREQLASMLTRALDRYWTVSSPTMPF